MGEPRQFSQIGCRVLQEHRKEDGADAEFRKPLLDRGSICQAGRGRGGQGKDHTQVVVLYGLLVSQTDPLWTASDE